MVFRPPVFYNNPDDSHCMVCCLRMGYEHFNPEKSWTYDELNQLIRKEEGKYTWFSRAYVETAALGYRMVVYDAFDYGAFAQTPEEYLRGFYESAHAEDLIANTKLERGIRDALATYRLEIGPHIDRRTEGATKEALKELIEDGYLVMAMIDEASLLGMEGKVLPHAVLVYDHDEDGFIAHNPGIKSLESAVCAQHLDYDMVRRITAFGTMPAESKMCKFNGFYTRDDRS